MDKLLLCTGNAGKAAEIRALIPSDMQLINLNDVGLPLDLPETSDTFKANALQKAHFAHERTGLPCLADDSGLEVDALDGAPGVYSARFAGPEKNDKANIKLLLAKLGGSTQRSARFRTVLAYVDAMETHCFEGIKKNKK